MKKHLSYKFGRSVENTNTEQTSDEKHMTKEEKLEAYRARMRERLSENFGRSVERGGMDNSMD